MTRRLPLLLCLGIVLCGCTLRIEVLPNVKIDAPKQPTTQPDGATNYREQWEQIR